MGAITEFSREDGYLLVKVAGRWTEANARQVIDESKCEVVQSGYGRLLFDLTQWSQPDSEYTRFASGKYLAEALPPPFRIAAFAAPGFINQFGEDAATNRGAQFRIFQDERSAVLWLMEGERAG